MAEEVEEVEESALRSQSWKHEAMVEWINETEGIDLDELSAAEVISWAFARRVAWRHSEEYLTLVAEHAEQAEADRQARAEAREAEKAAKAEEREAAKAAKEAAKAEKSEGKATTKATKAGTKATTKKAPAATKRATKRTTKPAEADPFDSE